MCKLLIFAQLSVITRQDSAHLALADESSTVVNDENNPHKEATWETEPSGYESLTIAFATAQA
jgi:hypothetical protein